MAGVNQLREERKKMKGSAWTGLVWINWAWHHEGSCHLISLQNWRSQGCGRCCCLTEPQSHSRPEYLPRKIEAHHLICHGKLTLNDLPLIQQMCWELSCARLGTNDWNRIPEKWIRVSWGDSGTLNEKTQWQNRLGRGGAFKKKNNNFQCWSFLSAHRVLTMRAKLHKY